MLRWRKEKKDGGEAWSRVRKLRESRWVWRKQLSAPVRAYWKFRGLLPPRCTEKWGIINPCPATKTPPPPPPPLCRNAPEKRNDFYFLKLLPNASESLFPPHRPFIIIGCREHVVKFNLSFSVGELTTLQSCQGNTNWTCKVIIWGLFIYISVSSTNVTDKFPNLQHVCLGAVRGADCLLFN